jgi:NAD(P)-dependent dehydrogenase (short-subunit alcohol dehydrogenase family)
MLQMGASVDKTRTLDGKVALVAGATRGAGRGTAVALGETGATVQILSAIAER